MLTALKEIIRKLPFYPALRDFRRAREIGKWNKTDEALLQFYGQFITPNDVVFDVGANLGNRTKVFLRLAKTVIAVEPQAQCMRLLKKAYGGNPNIKIVPKALGERQGSAEMMISNVDVLSSLSTEWVAAVRTSGRFSACDWSGRQTVEVTTLDTLIADYGRPSFIKIDVEGFEFQVIKGLSKTVALLSFEFTPECLESTRNCVGHLCSIGNPEFNFSLGESMKLCLRQWVGPERIVAALEEYAGDHQVFGDVYARFVA